MQQSFDSGKEFLEALGSGILKEPTVLTGVAKTDEADPGVILFSEGTSCVLWTRIPVEMIEKVEVLGHVSCPENGRLPYVRLHMKASDHPEVAVLAELLRKSSRGAELPCASLTEMRQHSAFHQRLPQPSPLGRPRSRLKPGPVLLDTCWWSKTNGVCGNSEMMSGEGTGSTLAEARAIAMEEAEYGCYNKRGYFHGYWQDEQINC
jgi:hypothetical protein